MEKVRLKENSWLAQLAARKLGFSYIAMVVGNTIHLYNTPSQRFLEKKRWVIHELQHVEQYKRHGFLPFLCRYFIEYLRKGYYHNRFEEEARAGESDESLLAKYQIVSAHR